MAVSKLIYKKKSYQTVKQFYEDKCGMRAGEQIKSANELTRKQETVEDETCFRRTFGEPKGSTLFSFPSLAEMQHVSRRFTRNNAREKY